MILKKNSRIINSRIIRHNKNMYSTTQLTNVTSIVGILMFVLPRFGINVGGEELTQFVGAVLTIGGIAWGWYHRYSKGDITPLGFKK